MDDMKAAHVCGDDCYVGDVSNSNGVLDQLHYHREGDSESGWAEDVFVGPRAIYILSDDEGDFNLPFGKPMDAETRDAWSTFGIAGPS